MKNKLKHIRSIKMLLIPFILLSLFSCRNYESGKYITHENEAINDLIPQLTNLDSMIKWNNFDTAHLKLLLISLLDIEIYEIHEYTPVSEGYIVAINSIELPEEEIAENKKNYEKNYEKNKKKHEEEIRYYKEKYQKEQKLFAPLTKGKLKKRTLDYKFEYSNVQIELIPENLISSELGYNEFGYLYISRIIFNRYFNKGYLSYSFWCGQDCYWASNIEIVKNNEKWEISNCFSGGIG